MEHECLIYLFLCFKIDDVSDPEEDGEEEDAEVAAVTESARTLPTPIIRPVPRMGEQTIPLDLSAPNKRPRLE